MSMLEVIVGGGIAICSQCALDFFRFRREEKRHLKRQKESLYLDLGDFLVDFWAVRENFIRKGIVSNEYSMRVNRFKIRNEVYASSIVKTLFYEITTDCIDRQASDVVIMDKINKFTAAISEELEA